ncbi:hypothetical protein OG994_23390 [Micromonospora globbae]|uniref:Uncharacterized protein n=1 Tax=Micromonospora globbae TaxID=1894969 RepID=A0ABZ1S3K1_9ACTN|nr:hypothetical protein [Micromonospora globbae]
MADTPRPRPNTTYSAPVMSVDLFAEGYEIWPCHDCMPWHAEVIQDDSGDVFVREWHAAECPTLAQVLAEVDAEIKRLENG